MGEPRMPKNRKPSYLLHKPSGQARVRIDGKDHYLGEYDSPESRDRYDELIEAWRVKRDVDAVSMTIDDLSIFYTEHAKSYYVKDGAPTREVDNIRAILRRLIAKYGRLRVREFTPVRLEDFRESLIGERNKRGKTKAKPLSRSYINTTIRKVVRMFKWGVSRGYVPVETWRALTAVEGLKKGRTKARETERIRPADDESIDAALPFLSPVVRAMVELQRHTGMRPGEVMAMRPCDVTRRLDGVWVYRPVRHKNEHHDQERVVFLGPKAQAVLEPWLKRDGDAPCFSPRDAVKWFRKERRKNRKTPVQPSQKNRKKREPKRKPGNQYSEGAYRQAIHRAIDRANENRKEPVPVWSPNQIRHGVATVVREKYGLEAAQVLLGHQRADDRMVDHVKDRDAKNPLSIGRLVCALAANDKRRAPAEFKAAMSESANVGGGFMVNEELSSQIIDIARAQSRFVQAGAMTVPMASETLRIARVSADPAMQVKAENSAFTESSITFDAINFTAYLVGCYVVASRELFADAPNAADLVEQTLGNALGAEIDRLCIRGDGDQEPVGALNTSGIGSTSSVSAIAWEDLHTGAVSIRALNYEPNGYIVHPTIAGDLDILATGDGSSSAKNWLGAPPSLDGVTRHQTTNITTADILIGDFTKAFIGMRQEAQVEVSTTAESFFSKHQVGVKITLRFDCNLAQAGAFHALNGITT
eukprot:g26702.t1